MCPMPDAQDSLTALHRTSIPSIPNRRVANSSRTHLTT
jgi:hypothetical protein